MFNNHLLLLFVKEGDWETLREKTGGGGDLKG